MSQVEELRDILERFDASISLTSRQALPKPGLEGIAEYIASGEERAGDCAGRCSHEYVKTLTLRVGPAPSIQ